MATTIEKVRRQYPKKKEFLLYKTRLPGNKKFKKVMTFNVCESKRKGVAVFHFDYKKKEPMNWKDWQKYLVDRKIHEAVFVGRFLPAMNIKNGYDWRFRGFLGFAPLK